MKVAVLAAGGRSGQAVVKELLDHGHQVVAGLRGSVTRLSERPGLTVRHCDATSLDDVKGLIAGCDAIVSVIGHVRGSQRDIQTAATMNIVRAARHLGVARVVSLTGTGVPFVGDHRSWLDRGLSAAVRLLDPARVQDGIDHAEILKASNLDWTLIRVMKLTNGPQGEFDLSVHGPGKVLVPRAEVAAAIRQVLETGSHLREAPMIGPRAKIDEA